MPEFPNSAIHNPGFLRIILTERNTAQGQVVGIIMSVQTVKTALTMVLDKPVTQPGSGYRWFIHWWRRTPFNRLQSVSDNRV
jgi:hypothetical protein